MLLLMMQITFCIHIVSPCSCSRCSLYLLHFCNNSYIIPVSLAKYDVSVLCLLPCSVSEAEVHPREICNEPPNARLSKAPEFFIGKRFMKWLETSFEGGRGEGMTVHFITPLFLYKLVYTFID